MNRKKIFVNKKKIVGTKKFSEISGFTNFLKENPKTSVKDLNIVIYT